jgi:hypothetical protein
MTTCTPIKPFRCWQYSKDSTATVPEWAGQFIAKRGWPLSYGDWLVEYDSESFYEIGRYTPAEFAERFKVTE